MMLSETELKEQEERNAVTELLFLASTGNVARMQTLIACHRIAVSIRNLVHKSRGSTTHGLSSDQLVADVFDIWSRGPPCCA